MDGYGVALQCWLYLLLGNEGVKKLDLVNWYLDEMQEEISSGGQTKGREDHRKVSLSGVRPTGMMLMS